MLKSTKGKSLMIIQKGKRFSDQKLERVSPEGDSVNGSERRTKYSMTCQASPLNLKYAFVRE